MSSSEVDSNEQVSTRAESSERYLAFSLSDEQYAIPLLQVKEVIAMTESTPVPYTPPYFKGIINLRGQVISVIDLRAKLGFAKATHVSETSIIILDLRPLFLGVIVDSINSVLALKPEDVSPSPDIESSVSGQYITGVARRDNRLSLLLNIRSILNVDDIETLKRSAQKNAA